ncbi:40S ribosomal protein S7-like, partial [Teleopsis dalmanni]|uniref:40S ribosomal protein S7-like n=1 Tax=Teleopsis dalmanni TaxID=139649 RepID=UPI0018CE3095
MIGSKIVKPGGIEPDDFEKSIAQALSELEANSDLKPYLRDLHITRALEIEFGTKKAVIIYVPIPQQKTFQKIQIILVRELEKKFSGKHVVVIGERKILPKPTRKRPLSTNLTAVYFILEDLVFPAEIVGKRIRAKLDGTQIIKVHLDKNLQTTIEH